MYFNTNKITLSDTHTEIHIHTHTHTFTHTYTRFHTLSHTLTVALVLHIHQVVESLDVHQVAVVGQGADVHLLRDVVASNDNALGTALRAGTAKHTMLLYID